MFPKFSDHEPIDESNLEEEEEDPSLKVPSTLLLQQINKDTGEVSEYYFLGTGILSFVFVGTKPRT